MVCSLQLQGFPHSDISGSFPVCRSPELFAAYHVLLRFRKPRHPPFALVLFLFVNHSRLLQVSSVFTRLPYEIVVPYNSKKLEYYTDYNLFITSLSLSVLSMNCTCYWNVLPDNTERFLKIAAGAIVNELKNAHSQLCILYNKKDCKKVQAHRCLNTASVLGIR